MLFLCCSCYNDHLWATVGNQAYVLNIQTGDKQPIGSAKENNSMLGVATSQQTIAPYGQEARLSVYDEHNQPIFRKTVHTDTIYDAILSPNNKQIMTLGGEGQLKMWDLETKSLLFTIDLPVKGKTTVPNDKLSPVYDFDFRCLPEGCWIAIPLTQGRIAVYPLGKVYD